MDAGTIECKPRSYARTFLLTQDICAYVDTLSNKSSWVRGVLSNAITKKEEPVTLTQVKRVVEEYIRRSAIAPAVVSTQGVGLLDEINAILGIGNDDSV